jgi:hypothetical protein
MIEFIMIIVYLAGVINCFHELMIRLNLKFPELEFDFFFKMATIILCCFSWLGLFFVLSNDELNS